MMKSALNPINSFRNAYFYIILISILALPQFAHSFPHNKEEIFAYSKTWLKALHYEKGLWGYKSRVDDERFFLHDVGHKRPDLELKKFLSLMRDPKQHQKLKCQFPYRYHIALEAELIAFVPGDCDVFDFVKWKTGAERVSIVYVSQYADNPSSIMGHLFLKFDRPSRTVENVPVSYIDTTVNYAAAVPDDVGIFKYVTYGIFGGFRGNYNVYEYADLMQKYNNMESRDIYVYPLNLRTEQIQKMTEHLWELANRGSQDYYFFDENCAQQLLAVINVVEPEKDMLKDLPIYTLPIDVIKTLEANHVIDPTKMEYTPSIYNRVVNRLESMTHDEFYEYETIKSGVKSPEEISSALVAEALVETIEFTKHENRGRLSEKQESTLLASLVKRSQFGIKKPTVKSYRRHSPHRSHGSSRVSIGMGGVTDGASFTELEYRPAVHHFLDRPQGFIRNSQFEILTTSVRSSAEKKGSWVDSVTLAAVAKLEGQRLVERLAWRFDLKQISSRREGCQVCLKPDYTAGVGKSYAVTRQADFYALGVMRYKQLVLGDDYGLGVGPEAGMFLRITDQIRGQARAATYFQKESFNMSEIEFALGVDVYKDIDARFHFRQRQREDLAQMQFISSVGATF